MKPPEVIHAQADRDSSPDEARDRRPEDDPLDIRLLRTADLVDLRLEARGCTLEPAGDGGSELVAGAAAVLVLHLPPQHLGEHAWQEQPPDVPGLTPHRAAGPSRLAFELPEGSRISFNLAGVLDALQGLALRVSPNATPGPYRDEVPTATGTGPEPPRDDETAIEAPYRLVVSPSERGRWRHAPEPIGPTGPDGTGRVELWRTWLEVRPADGEQDVSDAETEAQRIVRAIWTRDFEHGSLLDPDGLKPMSLNPFDRRALVEQTYGGQDASALTPLRVRHLALSSLGAFFDWGAAWEDPTLDIVDYRHIAVMGRDSYVRVAYPGVLYPFGHRCVLVTLTERKISKREDPVAYLWQRHFIIVRQPVRTYDDRDNPFTEVRVSPIVTPDLDTPPPPGSTFVPRRGGRPFEFTLTALDRSGRTTVYPAALVFVSASKDGDQVFFNDAPGAANLYRTTNSPTGPINQIQGRGQALAMATPVDQGDTSVEVTHLVFEGTFDAEAVTTWPHLLRTRAVVPSMRHLSPQAPAVDLTYAVPFIASGLAPRVPGQPPGGGPNPAELVMALASTAPQIDFSKGSDRSGGFLSPNMAVRGLSRALGAVGEDGTGAGGLTDGKFDPTSFLAGALPKLFGLFSLLDLLEEAGLGEVPAFVSDALSAVDKVADEVRRMKRALDEAQARLGTDLGNAPHDGARAVVQAAKNEIDSRIGPLQTGLDDVASAVVALGGAPDAAHVGALRDALVALAAQLQPLTDALGLPGFPASVRAALERPASALQALVEVANTVEQLLSSGTVTARMEWAPVIKPWPPTGTVRNIFKPINPARSLRLAVEVRASASAPPAVDVLAEIVDFELNLIGDGDAGLMKLSFQRIGFRAGSSGKPEVDVVFGGMSFLGPLSFVDTLRKMIPFDGFSDPPFVDISPEGATAGFDLALPNVGVGVFSLENISLGADARIPFLGDALTVGFHFCRKDSPFRLTVLCVGGGGWVELRVSPKGMVVLEVGLEACASLSIDLGVASGSVSIAVGLYIRLEADKGLLTAYFRIRGEVDVLGLISASITLELSLTYHFDSGKLIGRASLVVEVEVLFFSASVEIVVERRLAGSKGDPTMRDILPPDDGGPDDWAEYCAAFAPLPA